MKNKWYLSTLFISILFAFWFLYGIPLIIGIILLIFKEKENSIEQKKLNNKCLNEDYDFKKEIEEYQIYEPYFAFTTSENYKKYLKQIKKKQKEFIKNNNAIKCNLKKYNYKTTDIKEIFLLAFDSECNNIISKIKYSNFEKSIKKILETSKKINEIGNKIGICITDGYIDLKLREVKTLFEYQQKLHQEKEERKIEINKINEQNKLQEEIDEKRKKIEKEKAIYEKEHRNIQELLKSNKNDENLIEKNKKIEYFLSKIDESLNELDYRQAKTRAGYVYIISNIGSFGENVYKIGMTRRLDPQDRIDELSGASVPFKFDIHAIIFSEDAPTLEAALHRAFENNKINMINTRKEFFNITLDEIKEVVKNNYDKTVNFVDVPEAEQYRMSQEIKQKIKAI